MVEQGEIYDYDFGVAGPDSRQAGTRPALIIQTNHLNRVAGYGLTIVVPLSRTGRPSPSHVRLEPTSDNGLSDVSFAKCEQIFTVTANRLLGRRGAIAADDMFNIKAALRAVLTL